jgi:hypothetical protein
MTVRDGRTGRVRHVAMPPAAGTGVGEGDNEAFGGQGGYAAMEEYMKVLYSLLVDDGKLLRPETASLLFEPLLKEESKAKQGLLKSLEHPEWAVGWIPPTGEYDWSAGGLVVDGNSHSYRTRGFVQWGGVFNTAWVSKEDFWTGSLGQAC